MPETGEIRSAKSAVMDVMRDLSSVVSGWPREVLMPFETSVAEMTPVSSICIGIVSAILNIDQEEGIEYSQIEAR